MTKHYDPSDRHVLKVIRNYLDAKEVRYEITGYVEHRLVVSYRDWEEVEVPISRSGVRIDFEMFPSEPLWIEKGRRSSWSDPSLYGSCRVNSRASRDR